MGDDQNVFGVDGGIKPLDRFLQKGFPVAKIQKLFRERISGKRPKASTVTAG
jgi:hypothetical protein